MKKIIYEDDNWIIEKLKTEDDEYVIISYFRNNHFIEDIRISSKLMNSDEAIELIKEIILKEEIK